MAIRNDIVNFTIETQSNPYLLGKFGPIDTEITADDLEIIGEVPKDLNGVYVRNGPNPRYAPKGRYHWFDGDGMLHAVHIKDGRVSYRNRWIRTSDLAQEEQAGGLLWTGLLEPIKHNPGRTYKDTANTDVVFHNSQFLALWYLAGKPYRVDPRTLETLGIDDFGGKLRSNVSAHAKVDEHTGELMFFDYGPRPPYMTYGVVSANGNLARSVPIDLPGPRLPHDMAITERYSILFDLPLLADEEALKHGRYRVEFHRELPTRFGVLPRHGDSSSVRWFEAKPCYLYHTINAWEEGDEIVLEACRVKRPNPPDESVQVGKIDRMLAFLRLDAQLYRWRLNMGTGTVKEGPLDDENTEFPTINTWQLGRASRYAYNVHISSEPTLLFDGLVKYDTLTGRSETHWFGPGRYGSEAPFAPRSNMRAEDDGYLLSFVYDEREDVSELVILDAQHITDQPVARVRIPQRVPIGFHACWAPEEKLR